MRLRIILLSLSLLALMTTLAGGYLYYSSLEAAAFDEANRQAALNAEVIRDHLTSFVSENLKAVRALSGLQAFESALSHPRDQDALKRANRLLDHFKQSQAANVCYLMDHEGNTLASSNRREKDSFVGKNYGFRPYFQEAIQGRTFVYMALGVTSKKRGIYYSNPVKKDGKSETKGVVVIKASVESMEREFEQGYEGMVALVDPHGVIFMSNQHKWLYQLLWKPTEDVLTEIAETRQFGDGPWKWVGMTRKDANRLVDQSGTAYLVHMKNIPDYPGWKVVFLRNLKEISEKISKPIIRTVAPIILGVSILVGLAVFFLYRRASLDIRGRRLAEQALQESEETERALLNASNDRAFLLNREGKILSLNLTAARALGAPQEALLGVNAFDLFPPEIAAKRKGFHKEVVASGKPVHYVDEREGRILDTHVHPITEANGEVVRVALFSRDITENKLAEDQLKSAREALARYSRELEAKVKKRTGEIRRLTGKMMEGQEKERRAIARELHDELGQMLTALRMEAVWLRDHSSEKDPGISERALTMCELIDEAIDDVKDLAIRVRPGILDDLGLVEALEWYTGEFEKRTHITCGFESTELPAIAGVLATAVYRIAQEALTNVARHTSADHAEVLLQENNGMLMLSVKDDGSGFIPGQPGMIEGLGVAGMRERAALVGGELEIDSSPGKGTTVRFTVSLSKEEGAPLD